jgi:periplasmic protein TonB
LDPALRQPKTLQTTLGLSVAVHLFVLGAVFLSAGWSHPGGRSIAVERVADLRLDESGVEPPHLEAPQQPKAHAPSMPERPRPVDKKLVRRAAHPIPGGGGPAPVSPSLPLAAPLPRALPASVDGEIHLASVAGPQRGHGAPLGGAGGGRGPGGQGTGAFASEGRGAPASTQPPQLLDAPSPTYPSSARRRGAEGLVLLRARVGSDGRVLESVLARTSGSSDLDRAAVEAVRSFRFRPGTRGTEPVEAWVNVPVRFQLDVRRF